MQTSSAYMASKAAVMRFTDALATETAADGISVFAISPGTVKTEMTAGLFAALWDEPGIWSPPIDAILEGDEQALRLR